jgi:hypothetical protein
MNAKNVNTIKTLYMDLNIETKMIMSQRLWDKLSECLEILVKITNRESKETLSYWFYTGISANGYRRDVKLIIPKHPDGNHFDIKEGVISFHPGVFEQPYTWDDRWDLSERRPMRATMLAKHILHMSRISVTPADYEKYPDFSVLSKEDQGRLLNAYIESLSNRLTTFVTVDIKVSDDVVGVYSTPTAGMNVGTLGRACTRPESEYGSKSKIEKYKHLQNLRIVYATDHNNNLIGRALLWDNVRLKNGDSFTLMDRVYGSEDTKDQFVQYARDNGWAHKVVQRAGEYVIKLPDDRIEHQYYVHTGYCPEKSFPYLDSFPYIDEEGYFYSFEPAFWYAMAQDAHGNLEYRRDPDDDPIEEDDF